MKDVGKLIDDLAVALDAVTAGLEAADGVVQSSDTSDEVKAAVTKAAKAVKTADEIADAIRAVVGS